MSLAFLRNVLPEMGEVSAMGWSLHAKAQALQPTAEGAQTDLRGRETWSILARRLHDGRRSRDCADLDR